MSRKPLDCRDPERLALRAALRRDSLNLSGLARAAGIPVGSLYAFRRSGTLGTRHRARLRKALGKISGSD